MTTLEFSHNSGLVVVSFLIALVAGFTGLTLTKDLSQKSFSQRKIAVSLASVALGGGIWSMHFVAMLGLQMPVLFYYDAAITLASALLAILIVGVALGLLHFFVLYCILFKFIMFYSKMPPWVYKHSAVFVIFDREHWICHHFFVHEFFRNLFKKSVCIYFYSM